MLSFCDHHGQYGRREFLRIGGCALGGLTLPGLLATQQGFAATPSVLKNKSVIFLFMHGGPSQIETFDPKMTAPSNIHSVTGEVATKIPGITFGGTFKKLAGLADKLSVVRSYRSGDSKHDIKPIVKTGSHDANLGSIYSRIAGSTNPQNGMPSSALLFPRAVNSKAMPEINKFGRFDATGSLGSAHAPFIPGSGGNLQNNMQLSIPMQRLDDRRKLLTSLDKVRWSLDAETSGDGLERIQQQAFDVIVGGVSEAFDLSKEDPKVVARYDTAPLVKPDQINKKWNNYKRYIDNAQTLGKLLLLARRLCEAGCGFVTVTTNFVWDMHADSNNAGVAEGMDYMGVPFDHAVSAFIEDVADRGLSDDILLVCTGEMGRTPKLNNKGGRNHWGNLTPLMLSGGGLNMGHVVGQSTRDASEPLTDPINQSDLISSIMHTLFDVSQLRLIDGMPNDIIQLASGGKQIPGLFS